MLDILDTTAARVVINLGVLAILMLIGTYLVLRFRDSKGDDETASQLISKFREMHHRGDLDETEYRTIKSVLHSKFEEELKRNDEAFDSSQATAARADSDAFVKRRGTETKRST